MRPDAATLRLAVFPRPGLLVDSLLVARRGRVRRAGRAGRDPPRLHAGADHGPDVRRPARRRGPRAAARPREPLALLPRRADRRARLRGRRGRLGVGDRRHGRLPDRVRRRRDAHRLPRRARLGPPLRSAIAAMVCGNVVIYLFGLPWLAAEIDAGFDATLDRGPLPVHLRRLPEARARVRHASVRLEARGRARGRR